MPETKETTAQTPTEDVNKGAQPETTNNEATTIDYKELFQPYTDIKIIGNAMELPAADRRLMHYDDTTLIVYPTLKGSICNRIRVVCAIQSASQPNGVPELASDIIYTNDTTEKDTLEQIYKSFKTYKNDLTTFAKFTENLSDTRSHNLNVIQNGKIILLTPAQLKEIKDWSRNTLIDIITAKLIEDATTTLINIKTSENISQTSSSEFKKTTTKHITANGIIREVKKNNVIDLLNKTWTDKTTLNTTQLEDILMFVIQNKTKNEYMFAPDYQNKGITYAYDNFINKCFGEDFKAQAQAQDLLEKLPKNNIDTVKFVNEKSFDQHPNISNVLIGHIGPIQDSKYQPTASPQQTPLETLKSHNITTIREINKSLTDKPENRRMVLDKDKRTLIIYTSLEGKTDDLIRTICTICESKKFLEQYPKLSDDTHDVSALDNAILKQIAGALRTNKLCGWQKFMAKDHCRHDPIYINNMASRTTKEILSAVNLSAVSFTMIENTEQSLIDIRGKDADTRETKLSEAFNQDTIEYYDKDKRLITVNRNGALKTFKNVWQNGEENEKRWLNDALMYAISAVTGTNNLLYPSKSNETPSEVRTAYNKLFAKIFTATTETTEDESDTPTSVGSDDPLVSKLNAFGNKKGESRFNPTKNLLSLQKMVQKKIKYISDDVDLTNKEKENITLDTAKTKIREIFDDNTIPLKYRPLAALCKILRNNTNQNEIKNIIKKYYIHELHKFARKKPKLKPVCNAIENIIFNRWDIKRKRDKVKTFFKGGTT